jgi:hypothetical protein
MNKKESLCFLELTASLKYHKQYEKCEVAEMNAKND